MEKRAGLCHSDGPLHARISADQQSGWAHAPLMSALQSCGPAQSFHTGALIPNMTYKKENTPRLAFRCHFWGKKNHSNDTFSVTEDQTEKLTARMGVLDT